ncbi:MAG: hypothetical protein ACREIA_13425 [Opitutaceae bacterium]
MSLANRWRQFKTRSVHDEAYLAHVASVFGGIGSAIGFFTALLYINGIYPLSLVLAVGGSFAFYLVIRRLSKADACTLWLRRKMDRYFKPK